MKKPSQYSGFNDPQTWVIARIVLEQAKEHPQRIAIKFIGCTEWTFAELKNEALKSATWLQQQGVTAHTRVALMCNDPSLRVVKARVLRWFFHYFTLPIAIQKPRSFIKTISIYSVCWALKTLSNK